MKKDFNLALDANHISTPHFDLDHPVKLGLDSISIDFDNGGRDYTPADYFTLYISSFQKQHLFREINV